MFAGDTAIAHAVELVWAYSQEPENVRTTAQSRTRRIAVSAGDGVSCSRVHAWLARGDWLLQSAAAPRVAVLRGKPAPLLCRPLVLYSHLRARKADLPPGGHPDDGPTTLEGMWGRAQMLRSAALQQQRSERIGRFPLTAEGLPEKVRICYESDELRPIGPIGRQVSVTCTLYTRLGLTRDVIRRALAELLERRGRQVAPRSILHYNRFIPHGLPEVRRGGQF